MLKYKFLYPIVDRLTKNQLEYKNKLKRMHRSSSIIDVRKYQLEQLKPIVKTFHNKNIKTWEEFESLPILDKSYLPNITEKKFNSIDWLLFSYPRIIAKGMTPKPSVLKYETERHETSGSTGEPRQIVVPKDTWNRKDAVFMLSWEEMGWKGEKVLRLISGEPSYRKYDWFRNVYPMNYKTLSEDSVTEFCKIKPKFIHGPGGSIRQLCELVNDAGKGDLLKDVKVQWCSESWEGHYDRLTDFGMVLSQQYGLAELPTVVRPNSSGAKFPIEVWQQGYLELIDENNNVITEAGVEGDIVVSDFHNPLMPILRYRTGDKASYLRTPGHGLNSLREIKGRKVDYYYGPEVKRPVGWWLASPISHEYSDIISKWRISIDLLRKLVIVYYTLPKSYNSKKHSVLFVDYASWIVDNLGDFNVQFIEGIDDGTWKNKLIEVKVSPFIVEEVRENEFRIRERDSENFNS